MCVHMYSMPISAAHKCRYACLHTCICICVYACLYTCAHICLFGLLHACMQCIHAVCTHAHACARSTAYMHTHARTRACMDASHRIALHVRAHARAHTGMRCVQPVTRTCARRSGGAVVHCAVWGGVPGLAIIYFRAPQGGTLGRTVPPTPTF